jgi:hypothetical protein
MRFPMLLSLLPAALAEFDNCARMSGVWAGFDQGKGESQARAVVHSGGHIYIGGYASGDLSFGTLHENGNYQDHLGTSTTHDTHDVVSVHHATGSIASTGGKRNQDPASSQLGTDAVIYKMKDDGTPVSVLGFDNMPSDGVLNGTSVNGGWGGWTYIGGIDSFDLSGESDKVAVVGMIRGTNKFPMTDGSTQVVTNPTNAYDVWVAKVDMGTDSGVAWVTKEGITQATMDGNRAYVGSVVTTTAGDVITDTRKRIDGDYSGVLTKYKGANGKLEWSHDFDGKFLHAYSYAKSLAVDGETVYAAGRFQGKDSTTFGAARTSCEDGASSSSTVAAFDVSPSDAPVAIWATEIGCGADGYDYTSVTTQGNYIYVSGDISEGTSIITPATNVAADKCTLTGTLGGFVVKLNKADGKCLWAKDMSVARRIAANDNFVWTIATPSTRGGGGLTYQFDADHTATGISGSVFTGKFRASDGVGLWGATLGGKAYEYGYDMDMTPTGPIIVGYSKSDTFDSLGGVAVKNLQHLRAEAAPDAEDKDSSGYSTMFAVQLAQVDTHMASCISACPSGDIAGAGTTFADGKCYAGDTCYSDGEFGGGGISCFKCDAGKDAKALQGPIFDEHCFFNKQCVPEGQLKDNYRAYNEDSVCEKCQPKVRTDGYSLVAGHFHDRDFALTETQRGRYGWVQRRDSWTFNQISKYGMVFESQSNGCQVMPEMSPTVDDDSGLMTTVQKFAEAIKAVKNAKADNKGAEKAWLYYYGDITKCDRATVSYDQGGTLQTHKDTCANTPANVADDYGARFETILYYGQSMTRIKVLQGLTILNAELNNDDDPQAIEDLKADIIAHMLITGYQVVIHSAHVMQHGQTAEKAQAKADGTEAWNAMKDHWTGDANDKVRLGNLFAGQPDTSFHYCTASELLKQNMPASSSNHYGAADSTSDRSSASLDHSPTMLKSGLATHDAKAVDSGGKAIPLNEDRKSDLNPERAFLSAADLGVLTVALTDGQPPTCTFPPSPPPPPPPLPPPPLADQEAAIQKSLNNPDLTDKARADLEAELKDVRAQLKELEESKDDSSGLSDGEIAGVAVGAAIGGIVLLLVVGLILRSLLFKEAKPVFTCLEKAPAEKK